MCACVFWLTSSALSIALTCRIRQKQGQSQTQQVCPSRLHFIFRTSWFCWQSEENLFRLRSLSWGNAWAGQSGQKSRCNNEQVATSHPTRRERKRNGSLGGCRVTETIFTSRHRGLTRSHMSQREEDDGSAFIWLDERDTCRVLIGLLIHGSYSWNVATFLLNHQPHSVSKLV